MRLPVPLAPLPLLPSPLRAAMVTSHLEFGHPCPRLLPSLTVGPSTLPCWLSLPLLPAGKDGWLPLFLLLPERSNGWLQNREASLLRQAVSPCHPRTRLGSAPPPGCQPPPVWARNGHSPVSGLWRLALSTPGKSGMVPWYEECARAAGLSSLFIQSPAASRAGEVQCW